MKITYLFLLLVATILMLKGCPEAVYKDVSKNENVAHLIGKEFVVKRTLVIYGITMSRNYGDKVDYYVVAAPPGFSGPEIVEKQALPEGSKVKINAIRRCRNCLVFEFERYQAQVEILGMPMSGKEVYLATLYFNNEGLLHLNQYLFALCDSKSDAIN